MPQILDPDLPLTLLTLSVLGVLLLKVGLFVGFWLSLGRNIGCAAHNFWRLCEMNKANNIVYKNRRKF